MDAQIITELAARIADIAETTEGCEFVAHVEMSECADGSRRHYALVTTYDEINGLEQVYRVTTPAAWNSPAWASVHTEWVTEIRTGDTWLVLEVAATREP